MTIDLWMLVASVGLCELLILIAATPVLKDPRVGLGNRDDIPDSVVDMSVPDRGYSEWVTEVWTPYLEDDHEYVASLRAHHEKRRSKATTRRHNALGRIATRMRTRHRSAHHTDTASVLEA